MNDRNDENLRELFEQFWDSQQARSNLEDIERGEKILGDHPAPEPDEMLIANIKAEIALHLLPRKATVVKRIAYKVAAVAAAIIFIIAIGTGVLQNPDMVPDLNTVAYASNFTWDHHDSAVFNTELEQIESDLRALELGEEYLDNDSTVTELEMEVIEIAGDFWKG